MAKVQISIDDRLLQRIDNYADDNFISRSGLISLAMCEYLNSKEVIGLVKNLNVAVQKIADTGIVDCETLNELHDFQRICKMVTMN